MWAKSSTGRIQSTRSRDREHVVDRPELAHSAHHLDPERHAAALLLEPLAELAGLLDDVVERLLPLAAEQEAGMEDHELGAGRDRDPCGVVEHPDRHVQLLAALRVAHEAGDRRMDGEDDPVLPRELAEPLGPRVVHPELALEVHFAGGIAALEQQFDRFFGRFPGRNPRRAESQLSHCVTVADRLLPSDPVPTLFPWPSAQPVSTCSSSTSTSA